MLLCGVLRGVVTSPHVVSCLYICVVDDGDIKVWNVLLDIYYFLSSLSSLFCLFVVAVFWNCICCSSSSIGSIGSIGSSS